MSGPPDLLAALRSSKKGLATFEAMPPSHRRRWISFVEEAKKPETRARRIARCVADLTKGARSSDGGYSGTPLLQKLGIRDGHRVALIDAPSKLPPDLARMPAGVAVRSAAAATT